MIGDMSLGNLAPATQRSELLLGHKGINGTIAGFDEAIAEVLTHPAHRARLIVTGIVTSTARNRAKVVTANREPTQVGRKRATVAAAEASAAATGSPGAAGRCGSALSASC